MEYVVTKADGSRQPFSRDKIIRTCIRMGANPQTAYEIALKIERKLYNGISTAKILQMLFWYMRKDKPATSHLYDLRKGLSLMEPKPEFELFIQVLLANNGFEVQPNQILAGKCAEHEVDAIAKRNGITYFVEAKHHYSYHALTGLDESRIARAVQEDVTEGYNTGVTQLKIDTPLIVTNTKFSEQATRYASCRNILLVGWNTPPDLSVQTMIETKNLYPLSCLRILRRGERASLVNSGVVLIKQILEESPAKLAAGTGVSRVTLERIQEHLEQEM